MKAWALERYWTNLVNQKGGRKALLISSWFRFLYVLGFRFGSGNPDAIVPKRIIFICQGNICRSPYAEYYARSLSDFNFKSAGLDTRTGSLANARILTISRKRNVILDPHRTTRIEDYVYSNDDLLVCMEPAQSKKLRALFPNANISLLGTIGWPKSPYIHDPYGSNEEYVLNCLNTIENKVKLLVEHTMASNSKSI